MELIPAIAQTLTETRPDTCSDSATLQTDPTPTTTVTDADSTKQDQTHLPRDPIEEQPQTSDGDDSAAKPRIGQDSISLVHSELKSDSTPSSPQLASPSLTGRGNNLDQNVILGIAVVDFNHLVGPQVEYAHPAALLQDEDLVKSLPFLALPDGSHLSDEDFCYFHLVCPRLAESTIFGISCNRQIASDALVKKGAEVTRSTVQKAVVVLAKEPVFGPIKEKLGIVTRAFFAQGDLADVKILLDFHSTLEAGLESGGLGEDREAVMYMGTSLRELIFKWRHKTLMLVKLLLLQRRIMFFGYPVERLCTYQYSLVSMIPGLLLNLQDAGSPVLDKQSSKRAKAESLRTSDRKSLMKFLGMPLHLFGEDSFFQPYCPLQQIDMLKSRSWLVGTSNSIFKQQRDCKIDVVVDLEHSTLDFQDPRLHQVVGLTAADRKWMEEITHVVTETWNPSDPTRPTSMGYHGSDDFLRTKFEDYISAMLSSVKYTDFVAKAEPETALVGVPDVASNHNFGSEFIQAFKQTQAFHLWNSTTDPMLFDIVDHRHPCDGKTSAIEDVGLRLSAGLHDLRLEENLAPTREAIGSALQAGGANIYRLASNFRNDLARLRAIHAGGGPSSISGASSAEATSPVVDSLPLPRNPGSITGEAIDADGTRTSSSGATLTTPTISVNALASSPAVTAASQAASQAGTQVRAALGTFGSFLASKQKAWSYSLKSNSSSSPISSPSSPTTMVAPSSSKRGTSPPSKEEDYDPESDHYVSVDTDGYLRR
ncbi:hypothetical protein IE53DRAFT_309972 [Violaceomyces palustris]|uniref:Uncharacterized protein n=1 Tax=Violaceomyces palustris TaxID=1673888 RepID=A0ACD0P628_9BASI|nr:hypothetical protein IE53DRAFT_309972 [Violaceomyces palustris]